MAQFNDIWDFIEEKMQMKIPLYIKHILEHCGYDNFYSIASIEETDFEYFTNEVLKGKISAEKAFAESAMTVEDFEFTRGHRRLIMAFVKFVKSIFETVGVDGFSIPLSKTKSKTNSQNENVTFVPKQRKGMSISATSSTTMINQESNSIIKKVEDSSNAKVTEILGDCGSDSLSVMQSDRTCINHKTIVPAPTRVDLDQTANTIGPFASTYYYCSSHVLSQMLAGLKILSIQFDKSECRSRDDSIASLTLNSSDVSPFEDLNENPKKFNLQLVPQVEDYVICKTLFNETPAKWPESSQTVKYFVAQAISVNDEAENEVKLQFLKKSPYSKFKFHRPNTTDMHVVATNEIVKILDTPTSNRRRELVFNDNLLLDYNFD